MPLIPFFFFFFICRCFFFFVQWGGGGGLCIPAPTIREWHPRPNHLGPTSKRAKLHFTTMQSRLVIASIACIVCHHIAWEICTANTLCDIIIFVVKNIQFLIAAKRLVIFITLHPQTNLVANHAYPAQLTLS